MKCESLDITRRLFEGMHKKRALFVGM